MAKRRPIPIRVDPQLWQEVRKVAGSRKGSDALDDAMRMWLAKHQKSEAGTSQQQ